MYGVEGRFSEDRVRCLVEANWPPQELAKYKNTAGSCEEPFPVLSSMPSRDLKFPAKTDAFADPCPAGVSRDVIRMYRKSQVSTPLVWQATEIESKSWLKMSDLDGEPYESVAELARSLGTELHSMRLGAAAEGATAECLEKLSQCIDAGHWFYLVEKSTPANDLYRAIGRRLVTLEPDALNHPRRELFRFWLVVETAPSDKIDLNKNVFPIFPRIFTQNALLSVKCSKPQRGKLRKIVKPLATDPYGHPEFQDVLLNQVQKHQTRARHGRDSDSESDDDRLDDPNCPLGTGVCFVRANELATSSEQYGEQFQPVVLESTQQQNLITET